MPSNPEYTLIEFMAACESESFEAIEPEWLKWAEHFILHIGKTVSETPIHGGDCTKQACMCYLCTLEQTLSDYREYRFNPQKWRDENGI